MRIIDTHSHIYLEEFDEDRAQVVERAKQSGVTSVILPAINLVTLDRLEKMCQDNAGFCYPLIGLHPEEVREDFRDVLRIMESRLKDENSPYIGIGEIGLDFYWDATYRNQQLEAFEIQLQWAVDYDLPVIVHARNAHREIVDIVSKFQGQGLRGIFHCFCGSSEEAQELLQFEGFYLGIGGVLTFKKSKLPEAIRDLPLSRLLVETDSPYLAPVPHRGKRNESSFVYDTLCCLAKCKELPVEAVAEVTTNSAESLFGLNKMA